MVGWFTSICGGGGLVSLSNWFGIVEGVGWLVIFGCLPTFFKTILLCTNGFSTFSSVLWFLTLVGGWVVWFPTSVGLLGLGSNLHGPWEEKGPMGRLGERTLCPPPHDPEAPPSLMSNSTSWTRIPLSKEPVMFKTYSYQDV